MPWVPDFFTAWLTFPGVVLHTVFLDLCCRLTGTKVYARRFFRFSERPSCVLHDLPPRPWVWLVLGYGPLILGIATGAALALGLRHFHNDGLMSPPVYYVAMWAAFSFIAQSFPVLEEDERKFWGRYEKLNAPRWEIILGWPVFAFHRLLALGRVFWLHFIFAGFACQWLMKWA